MIPFISRQQAAKLDYLMTSKFGVPVLSMMEQAGYRLAEFIRWKFQPEKNVLICVGKGSNGGDGLTAARHLQDFGFKVKLFLITKDLRGEPAQYLKIANALKISTFTSLAQLKRELAATDIVLDCLIGYNLHGEPRGEFTRVIKLINASKKAVVACDIPSGVDCDRSAIYPIFVRADYILFLSMPKKGCEKIKAEKFVADIGVPQELYPLIKVKKKNYFEKNSILRVYSKSL